MNKIIENLINIAWTILFTFILSFYGLAQTHYTIWLENPTSTCKTMEFDVMFSVDSPTNGVKLSGLSVGINYNLPILNGGTLTFAYLFGKTPAINNLVNPLNSVTAGHLRIGSNPLTITNSIDIPVGTYSLGRYKVTNSNSWTQGSNALLWLQPTNTGGKTISAVNSYPYGATS